MPIINSNVIRKIEEPTEFVNFLVIVHKKDGTLHLCLDPMQLKSIILREHFYSITFEKISSRMTGVKYFSIIDSNKAFW